MSLKNPVTPPGIDPGTVRLVAQCLNHYAAPGPIYIFIYLLIYLSTSIYGLSKEVFGKFRQGYNQV